MNRLVILLILLAALLAGCATPAPKYSIPEPGKSFAIAPADKARIMVFRVDDSWLYEDYCPPVIIDNKNIGECPIGSFVYMDIPGGDYTVKTEAVGSPGQCEVDIKARPGQEYYFALNPRKSSFYSTVIGGGLFGALGALAGPAIDSSGEKCGGPFSLTAIDSDIAKNQIAGLKLNNW